LLGQAADLLDRQVRFRLKGIDRAEVGARLATIRLLDKRPARALDALRASAGSNLPADLVVQRRRLEARSLAGLGRRNEALALLQGDSSHDADLIRSNILWREQEWGKVASVLSRLVAEAAATPATPAEGAAPPDGQLILRLAVALTLDGDRPGLDRLRKRYGPVMDKTAYRDDFRIMTAAPGEIQNLDTIRAVAARIADVDQYEAFMVGYRERAKGRNLAAIN